MVCFVWGALLYFRIYNPPSNAMNVYIVGKQWMWKAEHPGGQHEINALHIPLGKPVQLTMISQDVFHSYSIPAFRVKREVIPGRYTTVWFTATQVGTYHLFCTQYCGTLHSQMIGEITVMKPDGLPGLDGRARPAACRSRRTASGSLPAWAAMPVIPGMPEPAAPILPQSTLQQVQLTNGSYATVDDAFLRDSILNPDHAHDRRLCAHHADVSGPDQRRRFDRSGRIHQETQLELSRSANAEHEPGTKPGASPASTQVQQTAPAASGMVKP